MRTRQKPAHYRLTQGLLPEVTSNKTRLNNHLSNALTSEGLAAHEFLAGNSSNSIESTGKEQQNRSGDQASGILDQTKPLEDTGEEVETGSSPERVELSHEVIEFLGGWTDAKQKWDLEEDDQETSNYTDNSQDNDQNVNPEDVGDTDGETDDDRQNTRPLSIYTKVPGLEFRANIREDTHFRGPSPGG